MSTHTSPIKERPITQTIALADGEWAKTTARFVAIATWQGDISLDNARSEVLRYYRETTENGGHWFAPNIARFSEGEIILEWWRQEKKLTIYFALDGTADYLASWGTDISADMDEGDAREPGKFVNLWKWLHSK